MPADLPSTILDHASRIEFFSKQLEDDIGRDAVSVQVTILLSAAIFVFSWFCGLFSWIFSEVEYVAVLGLLFLGAGYLVLLFVAFYGAYKRNTFLLFMFIVVGCLVVATAIFCYLWLILTIVDLLNYCAHSSCSAGFYFIFVVLQMATGTASLALMSLAIHLAWRLRRSLIESGSISYRVVVNTNDYGTTYVSQPI